jgi:hypothetical protein
MTTIIKLVVQSSTDIKATYVYLMKRKLPSCGMSFTYLKPAASQRAISRRAANLSAGETDPG